VTFIWRYHTSHADNSHFRLLVFGIWKNGDISTPLVRLSKNGSLVSYSDRIAWHGNKTTAVFQLHRVTIQDGGEYGLKLNFEAFTLQDSVNLTVIGRYISTSSAIIFTPTLNSEFQEGFEPMTVSLYRSKFIKLSTESASSPHHHFMISEAFDTTPVGW